MNAHLSNSELERLEIAVKRACAAYQHSKQLIAIEWARITSIAEQQYNITVADGIRSQLETLVPNDLSNLRVKRGIAKVKYEHATQQLESLNKTILAQAEAARAKQAGLAKLQLQKSQVLREINAQTDHVYINQSLRSATIRRGIKGLIHFTRIETLPYLQSYGLLSRYACGALGVPCEENDGIRLDHLLNHISLSISWPNWQLFYRFRANTSTTDEAWCVLVLHPNVIWTLDCLFTAENAASSRESHLTIKDRKGVAGFDRLFDDSGGTSLGLCRAQLGIEECMPTCHQAEVLVRQCVPWNRVLRIVVSSSGAMHRAKAVLPHSAHPLLKVNREPFDRRCDWKKWIDARGPRTDSDITNSGVDTNPIAFDDIPF